MEHLWEEIGSCAGGAYFTLKLRGVRARVCLMDAENYQAYLDEEEYEYHGGFWESSPVRLDVPYDGFWYLVVDSYRGRVKYWLDGPFGCSSRYEARSIRRLSAHAPCAKTGR